MKFRPLLRSTAAVAAFLASASLPLAALAGPPVARAPMRINTPARVSTATKPTTAAKPTAATAKAATTTQRTGQPSQSCGSATAPETPGHAASARGSAFNPNGTAGQMYAGQQPQNSGNPKSVSQYDVACSHQK
jgi:hypothetical protein